MTALLQLRNEDRTIKSIVVSQFTSFLTLIETPLRYVFSPPMPVMSEHKTESRLLIDNCRDYRLMM
jgi:hypothetical protein